MGIALFLAFFWRRKLSRSNDFFLAPGQKLGCRVSTHEVTASRQRQGSEALFGSTILPCVSAVLRSTCKLGEGKKSVYSTVVAPQVFDSDSSLGGCAGWVRG